jgi:stress-induced morphogen
MTPFDKQNSTDFKDITDVWNITDSELKKINETMISLENNLQQEHQGHYFDYQLVDDFFQGLSDVEKAMIFVYGQLVHDRIYKKNL